VKKSLAGAVHTWPNSEVPRFLWDVR